MLINERLLMYIKIMINREMEGCKMKNKKKKYSFICKIKSDEIR